QLQLAFQTLIDRHDVLRTSFHFVEGELVQTIHPKVSFQLQRREVEAINLEQTIQDLIQPFDLSQPPLLRAGCIRLAEQDHILLVDMHHIISDGNSLQLLFHELSELYQGRSLPKLPLQYRDYAVWQRQMIESDALKEQETFWLAQFQDNVPITDLPTDYPRPAVQKFQGDLLTFQLPPVLAQQCRKLAIKHNVTLQMVLFAAYYVWLMK